MTPLATSLERNILVTNRIAIILGVLCLLLLAILVTAFGTNVNTPIIFGVVLFFFSIPRLNKWGFIQTSRILLCIVPLVITMLATVLLKISEPGSSDILYYDARFFLIIYAIIPCLIFDTVEYIHLYGCLGFILLIILLFDPIHEFFGVGYYQMDFQGPSYYYINYVVAITFTAITAGSISLKYVIEKAERNLYETNRKLQESYEALEAQNEEIMAQSEELYTSQESLVAANQLIEKQKQDLQSRVKQVNHELQETNEELVKHNNQLQQFSLAISHNLRGPIARLLGLTQLLNMTADPKQDQEALRINNLIRSSASELDSVIRDLSAIVDLRHGIQKRQLVAFSKEWNEVKSLLNISEEFQQKSFQVDFSAAPIMYSVTAMVQSILFNLVSNATKYRSHERELNVRIVTKPVANYIILEVSDNGLGIDLKLFQNDLFKMYKRFHNHREGKGLGLYLIKSQVESLNGFIELASEPGQGSTFRIHLPNQSIESE